MDASTPTLRFANTAIVLKQPLLVALTSGFAVVVLLLATVGTPSEPGIPLALRQELPATVTAEQVLELARLAGLEKAAITPECVGYTRVSAMGATRQLYYVRFSVTGFEGFRTALGAQVGPDFKPAALSPILMMAAQPDFTGWMPIGEDAKGDCIAPVTIE